jgi:AcrR family transcriptional regulator
LASSVSSSVASALDTRARLLDAATAVVLSDGMRGLTLDAVAQRARVSKGGLLYHFPSRQALVEALMRRWIERFELEIAAHDDGSPGAWIRGYLRASQVPAGDDERKATDIGMMTALLQRSEDLDHMREQYDEWQRRLTADGVDPAAATLVRLAADGLWLADLFGLASPDGALREQVLARLEQLLAR